jgi:superfamily II DNA or RNA helicase
MVAATGTGKTVVAAFDYRRICEEIGGRLRLLFVAHREEILRQTVRTFREDLGKGNPMVENNVALMKNWLRKENECTLQQ